ncbi:hypothetical protein [Melissococcus plutonius]|uniref:hypothetical protein n=1 Tax=Melissococcus plutonius TaxID=33970 RepID=UPI003C2C2E38
MKLYRYESSKNSGYWTESISQAYEEFEGEKEYLTANKSDGDEIVKLVSIKIPSDLIDKLEDESEELRGTEIGYLVMQEYLGSLGREEDEEDDSKV